MKAKEAREIAKNTLTGIIGVAYYKIADSDEYTEDEQEAIINYINQYGKSACKAIGKIYVAY